jgi:hypothetical protein
MKIPRLFEWYVVSVALMAFLAYVAPHQLPILFYKLNLVTLSAVVGYLIDRTVFPYARPDRVEKHNVTPALYRRAAIIIATMIAITQGL